MKEKIRLNDIVKTINQIEKKYDIFNKKIEDVYFWKLIRMDLYEGLLDRIGFFDSLPHASRYKNTIHKIIDSIKQDYFILRFNALKCKCSTETIIFRCSTRTYYNNKKIDTYTYFIEEWCKLNNKKYVAFESDTTDELMNQKQTALYALGSKYKRHAYAILNRIHYQDMDIELLKEISNDLAERLGISIDLIKICSRRISFFQVQKKYYQKLFKLMKSKRIIFDNSYGREGMISAAQELNIQAIEVQHGVITKQHLGYSFPDNEKIPYFPDRLLMFGKYWYDSAPIPLKEEDISIIGYPYLIDQFKHYREVKKTKNSVVFLSQGGIANRLINIAYGFAQDNPDYKIIYKLHPSEYIRWREIYPQLLVAANLENFKIIDTNTISLYQVLAEAEYQVGINSTAIFEGLVMEAKTVLIDMPGIEYMDWLIEKGIVMVAKDCDSLKRCIRNFSNTEYDADYFYSKEIPSLNMVFD